jgi:hypothetical protein
MLHLELLAVFTQSGPPVCTQQRLLAANAQRPPTALNSVQPKAMQSSTNKTVKPTQQRSSQQSPCNKARNAMRARASRLRLRGRRVGRRVDDRVDARQGVGGELGDDLERLEVLADLWGVRGRADAGACACARQSQPAGCWPDKKRLAPPHPRLTAAGPLKVIHNAPPTARAPASPTSPR